MKKIKIFILSFLAIFILGSCKNEEAILDNLNKALETLELSELNSPLEKDFTLNNTLSFENKSYEVSYTSQSNYLDFSKDDNLTKVKVYRPSDSNSSSSIIASISEGKIKAEKSFNVKILKGLVDFSLDEVLKDFKIKDDNQITESFDLPAFIDYKNIRFRIKYKADQPNLEFLPKNHGILAYITKPRNNDLDIEIMVKIASENDFSTKAFTLTMLKATKEELIPLEDKPYDDKDMVADYIIKFKKLPKNFYTKEAIYEVSEEWTIENKISIGGDSFYNREGILPRDSYYECDIDYRGSSRGAKRLVFSLKSLNIYYTSDHYESFTQIYKNGVRIA